MVPAGVDVELNISAKVTEVVDDLVRVELTVMCGDVKVLGSVKGAIKWPKN